jgi:hypothetical protein
MVRGIRRIASDTDLRVELSRRGPLQAAKFDQGEYRKRLIAAYARVGVEIRAGNEYCSAGLQHSDGERRFGVGSRG